MKFGSFVVMFIAMTMILEFMAIPTGASAILSTFGIDINPVTAELISSDVGNSGFYREIFGASGILIIIGAAGAVIIGLFAKSYDTSLVILPLIVFIGGLLIATPFAIILYAKSFEVAWLTKIIALVFTGLGVAFLMSCVDYFANR